MAYTSIYRKYRPVNFDGVIGQDHIVRTLKNQIATDCVGHAYIFTGTRGTGKTSVAKIFAKAVNCLNTVDGSPCGQCATCRELAVASNFDILEIDAASNNSVDQIRELTDKVNFAPTIGRYKVYIIDEVHMLSKSAHNALLKTLEEPPSHAIFILATTEIHQIPATILSRCLRFDFRLVPNLKIANHIRLIFDDMRVKAEPQAVDLIASAGNGSVRDALSIADMCVSYCMNNVTYLGVLEVLGASDPQKLQELSVAIAEGNIDLSLKSVANMCDLGKSIPILATDIATLFRNVLYIKNCSTAQKLLALPEDVYQQLKIVADKYSVTKCMAIMKIMTSLEGEFHYSSQHRILFESAVVLACIGSSNGDNSKIAELEAKVSQLEKRILAPQRVVANAQSMAKDARQVWKAVAAELEKSGYQFLAFAVLEAEVEVVGKEFLIKVPSKTTLNLLTEKSNRDVLNKIFAELSDCRMVFEETKKLDEDKALPYIKSMFGKLLEVK